VLGWGAKRETVSPSTMPNFGVEGEKEKTITQRQNSDTSQERKGDKNPIKKPTDQKKTSTNNNKQYNRVFGRVTKKTQGGISSQRGADGTPAAREVDYSAMPIGNTGGSRETQIPTKIHRKALANQKKVKHVSGGRGRNVNV